MTEKKECNTCSECGQVIKENNIPANKRLRLSRAATAINDCLTWDDTKEGEEYWNDVFCRLIDISEGKPL